ncbi:ABC transporter ATP-binding protein [Aureimonas leprariae]|uniref:sn-glycerol-3-phosphate ABC transporter ATP-binding protein UgpC n=1 Tax=Plantimonas leprariae TaxID=2615207 RepID=A0A7V7PT98_9HYPH|nr:sn-glycerol-3-phosphate ABC transporter ATP-binding protein UgpC [Aureimonas leprariae]KAB0682944.1 sn-glycerol-3-phosphate ABC transporter ATP-binding protein UgpC [Aureimonas leprariae]
MATVEIRGLKKAYNKLAVLHGIDVDIADGEFVVLVGPSGCGKSTLLRMIAGLEDITGGELRIGGRVVNDLPPRERDLAMVFQNYALYPHLTVRANMAFSLKLQRMGGGAIDARVEEIAKTLGLQHLLDRYPRQLSGGQRQRVAMGRAIVRAPQLFLFDEPLSNLDAKLRVQVRSEIKALHQRHRTTTIYVTHDQVEAMTMGDKVVVMRDGLIEQMGDPLTLYDRPATRFVAGFIGSPAMNLLEARVENGEVTLANGDRLPLGSAAPRQGGDGPVTCGIRPEHLTVADRGIDATVEVVEPTGSETIVMLQSPVLPPTERLCMVLRERLPLRSGDRLRLAARPEGLHFFDPESGERL